MTNTIEVFVKYCMSFYGPNQLYDVNATEDEIRRATNVRIATRPDIEFVGDSVDREMVRDIFLAHREPV
jgi:hypothetical protein